MSITVPTRISKPIKITKDCIKKGGTVSANIKNGLVDIIVNLFLPHKISSTLIKIDQPRYNDISTAYNRNYYLVLRT